MLVACQTLKNTYTITQTHTDRYTYVPGMYVNVGSAYKTTRQSGKLPPQYNQSIAMSDATKKKGKTLESNKIYLFPSRHLQFNLFREKADILSLSLWRAASLTYIVSLLAIKAIYKSMHCGSKLSTHDSLSSLSSSSETLSAALTRTSPLSRCSGLSCLSEFSSL